MAIQAKFSGDGNQIAAHWWRSQSGTCAGATATADDGLYGRHRYFIYDRAGHLIGQYDNAGHLIKAHIWLNGHPIAVATPEAIDYVTTDQLGTPRVITNADQTIVWRWQSTPFGIGQPNNNPSGLGSFTYNLRLPGQYYDADTGLHYNWHRYYDPRIGRYTRSDPIGLSGGANTYVYVDNDSVNRRDLSGLQPGMLNAFPVPGIGNVSGNDLNAIAMKNHADTLVRRANVIVANAYENKFHKEALFPKFQSTFDPFRSVMGVAEETGQSVGVNVLERTLRREAEKETARGIVARGLMPIVKYGNGAGDMLTVLAIGLDIGTGINMAYDSLRYGIDLSAGCP